jgi:hypothetical protein
MQELDDKHQSKSDGGDEHSDEETRQYSAPPIMNDGREQGRAHAVNAKIGALRFALAIPSRPAF